MRRFPLALPFLLGSLLVVLAPLVVALYFSFVRYHGFSTPEWTGIQNWERLRHDSMFWKSVGVSALIAALVVPVRITLAVGASLLLARGRGFGVGAGRVSAYLPSVIPDAAWALLWLWILNPLYGPLPALLDGLGVEATGLLTTPWGARIALVLVLSFQIGEAFVVAWAARAAIPHQSYEALATEGASSWFTLRRLTLPLMAPIIALLAIRDVVLVVQNSFVPVLLLTGGGPADATTTAPLHIYRRAFEYGDLGYASTLSIALLGLTLLAVAGPMWCTARLIRNHQT